jgi:PAS domain S-box-containing protein
MTVTAGPSRWMRVAAWLPLAVLLLCGAVLFLGWRDSEARRAEIEEEQLALEAGRVTIKIAERLDAYDEILRGAAGLIAASDEVTREEWRRYVAQLKLGQAYRGIQGVGFSVLIPAERLAAHQAATRAEGFPEYRVRPEGPREVYSSIVFLEPFAGRNLRAFGYDMYSEPVRRAAMDRARDNGDVATSGMVTLVQETETDVQPGILTYVPVYAGGTDPGTVEGRRAAIEGWAYSPLRMRDLMEGILEGELANVRLEVFDGPEAVPERLLYDSRPGPLATGFVITVPFGTNGRAWTLRFQALPGFVAAEGPHTPWGDLWPLSTIAVLLAGLSWALVASLRARAREAALTESIRASEARYRSTFEHAPVGMFNLDAEGRFLTVNPRYCELTGHSEEELVGMHAREVVYSEDRAIDEAAVRVVREGREPVQMVERRRVRKDGSVFWGQVTYSREAPGTGAGATLLGVLQDVTERREAEDRFRVIAEGSPVAIGIVQDGVVVYANPAAGEVTGYPPEEILGQTLDGMMGWAHEGDRALIADGAARPDPAPDGTLLALSYRIRRKDGTERLVQQAARPVQHRGRPALLFTATDVTERERVEEELRRAQRLESLALLASGIAHDFNNLLTAVFGHVEVARGAVPPGSASAGELAVALSALGRARDLTRQLLTFSSGGTPQRRALAVARLLSDAAALGLGGSAVRARFEVASGLPPVDADEGQMSQLLNNLLINARQAMPGGGEVVLRARERTVQEGELPEIRAGRYVEIEVEDHGHGIPAEILPRVFDPFFTTRDAGTGLGLATSYSIARRHGGRIGITSRVGEGTTVRILLPVSDRPPEPARPAAPEAPREGVRVLLMDDEPLLLKVGVKHLRALGCLVETAANGEEALAVFRLAREAGRPFQVAILDLTIAGGMGGRETAEQLRALDPSLVAIACSGYFEGGIMADPAGHGFQGVLAKPYVREDLARALGLATAPT